MHFLEGHLLVHQAHHLPLILLLLVQGHECLVFVHLFLRALASLGLGEILFGFHSKLLDNLLECLHLVVNLS